MRDYIQEMFAEMIADLTFNEDELNRENYICWLETQHDKNFRLLAYSDGPAMHKLVAIKQMIDTLNYQTS